MSHLFTPLALCSLVLMSACWTETAQQPRMGETQALAVARAVSAWEAVEAGRVVGVVVEFHEKGGARCFFSVRNGAQQELGMVDAHGRVWRYRPHAEEAEWLGSSTVLEGARRILSLEGDVRFYEVGLESLRTEPSADH